MQNQNIKNEDLWDDLWPGNIIQCWEVLLNAFGNKDDSNLLSDDFENEEFLEKTRDWSGLRLVKGAIFCLFEYHFENFPKEPFSPYLWKDFFLVSICPKYNIELLTFARDMQYFKKSPKKVIFEGFYKAIFSYNSLFTVFFKKKENLANLENILYTLNVPKENITFLMTEAYETKSFKGLLSFLEKEPNFFLINETFLLEKNLLPFSVLEKNKNIAKELESLYEDFLEEKKMELEEVDVFDAFVSGEETKNKSDVFGFLFSYQTFCLGFDKNKSFCLNLFLIFENYVILEKETNTTIANLTKKELFSEISNFCIAKKDLISFETVVDLPTFDQKWKKREGIKFPSSLNAGLILLFLASGVSNPQFGDRYMYNIETTPKIAINASIPSTQQSQEKSPIVSENLFPEINSETLIRRLDKNLSRKGFSQNNYQVARNNQLTVYNSLVIYNRIDSYKRNVDSFLDFPHPKIEFDHFLNNPFCKAVGFRYNEGLTVSRPVGLHRFLTGNDKIELPDKCGYGPNRGNVFEWVDIFFSNKLKNIELYYEKNSNIPDLPSLSETLETTKKGMVFEVARLNRITTPHHLILVVNDFITLCQKATNEARKFKDDIPLKIQSGVKVFEVVEEFKTKLEKCEGLYAFHDFLSNKISKESIESIQVEHEFQNFNSQVIQSLDYFGYFDGKVTEQDKEYMLKPAFTPASSWQELKTIATERFGYKQRTHGFNKPLFYRSSPSISNKELGVLDNYSENIEPGSYI